MVSELILDTGPFVGLLDRSQNIHRACVRFYEARNMPVVTTEAVLTEAMLLLSGVNGGKTTYLDFVLRGGALLVPSSEGSLRRCRALIEKYADLPMDFAGASLVVLAEELNTDLVFTMDRDFKTYRIFGKKRFRIFPEV